MSLENDFPNLHAQNYRITTPHSLEYHCITRGAGDATVDRMVTGWTFTNHQYRLEPWKPRQQRPCLNTTGSRSCSAVHWN